ncbi:hypothetical protein M885DRAFT_622252 [Pelagophyceae sp. CCMP2097]|nr:hypothetical protein M885DRAFT_622252 [Pelagophyceae sp. CCMP2097]
MRAAMLHVLRLAVLACFRCIQSEAGLAALGAAAHVGADDVAAAGLGASAGAFAGCGGGGCGGCFGGASAARRLGAAAYSAETEADVVAALATDAATIALEIAVDRVELRATWFFNVFGGASLTLVGLTLLGGIAARDDGAALSDISGLGGCVLLYPGAMSLTLDSSTLRGCAASVYAAFMVLVIPAGVPLAFSAYLWEVVECLRRVLFVSVLGFLGTPQAVTVIGVALSICFAVLHRDVMPFGDQGTNFFCVVWKWVVVACYLAMLVASRPENSFKALGPAMVAAVLATEQDLKLLEFEAISAETVMQDAERRCDTDALRGLALGAWTLRAEASALQRIFGDGAARGRTDSMDRSAAGLADGPARRRTDSAESWATADAADAPPPHASSHAMVPPGSGGRRGSHTLSHGLSSGGGNSSPGRRTSWPAAWHALQRPKSSFDAALYPCFVLPVSALAGMSALPQHEAALAAGVSKVWKCNKLLWLRGLRKHLAIPDKFAEVWIWIDISSVPQLDAKLQRRALQSLAYYSQLCSRFLPLVRDADAWRQLYGEDLSAHQSRRGTPEGFFERGWCRVELMAGLAPKRLPSGAWQPGPRNLRFRYHHDPDARGIGAPPRPLLHASMLLNPLEGDFTSEADRLALAPVVSEISLRYALYAASGADEWAATIDVRARPEWFHDVILAADDADDAHLSHGRPSNPRASDAPRAASGETRPPPKHGFAALAPTAHDAAPAPTDDGDPEAPFAWSEFPF